jgi:hypothetical protein
VDHQEYRVTFLCPCQGDYTEGYGATAEAARAAARGFYRRGHPGEPFPEEILERSVEKIPGYFIYEEVGT